MEGNDRVINFKSICCENIPENFLDKLVAKNYFSKFGKITRFILRPNRLKCTVEYSTKKEAEAAYMDAGNYNGKEFLVNYAEENEAHVQNTEEWIDPDVKAELEAMGRQPPTSLPPVFNVRSPPTNVAPALRSLQKSAKVFAEQTKVQSSVRTEIESILRRPALTVEEKYSVLDARDKLIRLTTIRQTDIKKAETTKGICPDMCPEKERLMREFQRQVSTFEIANTTAVNIISHRRAIKEYARSSADQEVPLAHELRPESVLRMTMLYMMRHIMDLCDSPEIVIGDWFHFIWDRTRSIRKDITQQELCSLNTVELVEQCARFHIHCAGRLVAEDPSVFDKKINTENLTKCLQTLKYMYHDLRLKNISCPCEAEFRSYIVLLNLGDSNFLWELTQLPANIQSSRQIKWAMQFYIALQNNNYVRFFNMVRLSETTYLSACILLRYFNEFRLQAMKAIIKSHSWGKNPVFLPLSYLARILAFEDEQSAATFFEYHGLFCERGRVRLGRLIPPDMEYTLDRVLMVESKRNTSVGECVCGGPLESADVFENHQPHSSFDSNGFLNPLAWTADDQLRGEAARAHSVSMNNQFQLPAPPPPPQIKVQTSDDTAFTAIKADDNIFKIPKSSALASKLKTPQQQKIEPAPLPYAGGASPYNKNTFGSSTGFGNAFNVSPFASTNQPSQNMFKMPTTSVQPLTKSSATSTTTFSSSFQLPLFTFTQNQSKFEPPPGNRIFNSSTFSAGSVFVETHDKANKVVTTRETAVPPSVNDTQKPQPLALPVNRIPELLVNNCEATTPQMQSTREQQEVANRMEEQEKDAERERALAIKEIEMHAEREYKLLIFEEIAGTSRTELDIMQKFSKNCQDIYDEFFNDAVTEETYQIIDEELTTMLYDQLLLSSCFRTWLLRTRRKKEQRKLFESVSTWVSAETLVEKTRALHHPSQDKNLRMIKRYRQGQPSNFKALLARTNSLHLRPHLNIFNMFAKCDDRTQNARGLLMVRKYYKLVFTLPAEFEELPGFESLCNRWLQKYIKIPEGQQKDMEPYICALENNIALCVRKLTGIEPVNERKVLAHHEGDEPHGIICFMSCGYIDNTKQRLVNLLKKSKIRHRIPLAIVVYNGEMLDEQELADLLKLDGFVQDGEICSYKSFGCLTQPADFCFIQQLGYALQFMAREIAANKPETLEMQTVENWLKSTLGEEMWHRWHASAITNLAFNKICNVPNEVIGLYNYAVGRLQAIICEDFGALAGFPAELREFVPEMNYDEYKGVEHFPSDWRDKKRQSNVVAFLENLKLPSASPYKPTDLDDAEVWLLDYGEICIPDNEIQALQVTNDAIKSFIEQLNQQHMQDMEITKRITMANFLPVIKHFVNAHINNVLDNAARCNKMPTEIMYRRAALLDYYNPWWLKFEPINNVVFDYSVYDASLVENACEQEDNSNLNWERDFDSIYQNAQEISYKIEQPLSVLRNMCEKIRNSKSKYEVNKALKECEMAKLETTALLNESRLQRMINEPSSRNHKSTATTSLKRTRESSNEMQDTIDNAFHIIKTVEKHEDCKRLRKSKKL